MRFDGARPLPPGYFLDGYEGAGTNKCRGPRGSDGSEPIFAPEEENEQSSEIPKPTVPRSCSRNRPKPDPFRCRPLIHLAHEPVIAGSDELQHYMVSRHFR